MIPIQFNEQNMILTKPENTADDKCSSMPVYCLVNENKEPIQFVSCWYLTPEERKIIIETGRVYVYVMSGAHPPILLDVNNPFIKEENGTHI